MKEIFLTVILLSLLFSIIQCQKQEEIEALEHFYSSTNGGYWYNNSNWLVGSPCSNNWHGVTCDGDNNIIKLELNINFLTGNISDLSNLSSLQVLDLSENYLSGPIHSSIYNIKTLQILNLFTNSLYGSISPNIKNLQSLTRLALFENELTSSIPDEIGDLMQLTWLDLDSNPISGPIPNSIGNLVNMQEIFLDWMKLSGTIPSSIGNLQQCIKLYLNNNQLEGTIPTSLFDISVMQKLRLNQNFFSGTFPWGSEQGSEGLLKYQDIYNLWIQNNHFTGVLPDYMNSQEDLLQALPLLTDLNAANNEWTPPVPSWCASSICSTRG